VENEYGSYPACDNEYLSDLRDILKWHIGKSAVLYSTDGNSASFLKCGKVEGVYATVDFGTGVCIGGAKALLKRDFHTRLIIGLSFAKREPFSYYSTFYFKKAFDFLR